LPDIGILGEEFLSVPRCSGDGMTRLGGCGGPTGPAAPGARLSGRKTTGI
jgi:hypothetical protein